MLQRMFLGDPPGMHDRFLDFSRSFTGSNFFVPSSHMLDSLCGVCDKRCNTFIDIRGRAIHRANTTVHHTTDLGVLIIRSFAEVQPYAQCRVHYRDVHAYLCKLIGNIVDAKFPSLAVCKNNHQ